VVSDYGTLVKTGMKLKLSNGIEYILIVRGDILGTGQITITDLSKIILHYNEVSGFLLTGYRLKAADMDFDGEITLTDVSQLLIIYNSI